jgi:sortase A
MRIRRLSKMQKWISNIFLAAGIIGIGIWAWSLVRNSMFQHRANRIFDEQTHTAAPPPGPQPLPKRGDVIGRLLIPRLELRAIVREGDDGDTLDLALGHVPGTALPGRAGNVGIAGHRDTLFRCLRHIAKDDLIVLETTQGSYAYDVEDTSIVKPQDVAVLAPSSQSEITLVTCYPFNYVGPAPDRFIVRALLLPSQPGGKNPQPGKRPQPSKNSSAGKKLLARRGNPPGGHSARVNRSY